jgi:hypothetical protein
MPLNITVKPSFTKKRAMQSLKIHKHATPQNLVIPLMSTIALNEYTQKKH